MAKPPKRLTGQDSHSAAPLGLSIDALPSPYLIAGGGSIVYANRAAHARFDTPARTLEATALSEFVCPRSWADLQLNSPSEGSGWVTLGEFTWRAGDGSEFTAEASAMCERGELHLLLHASSARERTAAELARLEDDVARLQALGGLGRYELQLSASRKNWFSDAFFRIIGRDPACDSFTREEFLAEVVHPEDRELVAHALSEVFARRGHYELEYRILRPDGEVRHVRSSGDPVLDARGDLGCLRGALVDVTSLVQSATELRHQGAWLSAILDTAVEAIILIDSQGDIKSVNPATQRVFGYTPDELRGQNVKLLMPDPYREEHDGYLGNYLATGVRKVIGIGREVTGLRKDGTRFPMDLAVSEMHLGGVRMFSGFVRDATERKRLEAEFLHSQKNEIVGRLSEGIAHDFNNMLMGIRSCARLAEEGLGVTDPTRALLGEIEVTTQRGMALTRRLLAFGRNEPARLAPTSLASVIDENVPMWRRLVGEEIEIVVGCIQQGDVLLGDPGLLEQILINLVVNARDAMPQGGRVWIETLREGSVLQLSVRDEGMGMDPTTCERIFEPFFTTKPAGQGTGLGLSTVMRIVRELSGRIQVDTQPGRGTCFRIRFPALDSAPVRAQPAHTAAATPQPGRGTILLVEDEALIRFALRQSLGKLGYSVLAAADGRQALELGAMHEGRIDLVVTDVVLPNLGGREVVDRLRERHPELRAIFMSAHARETLLRQGRLPENAAYLEKPYDLSDLALLVRQVLA
ncbi:MAG: PAS domain S-box protein [Planctomycetes bacterium]|nr:PAS domain S-box protein [Planctomycetota bacterium]